MIDAAVTGERYTNPDLGEVWLRHIGNDVYIDVFSILKIIGDFAVPYLKEYCNDTHWGFEGKNLIYAPSDVVFKALNDFQDALENDDDIADEAKLDVANKFGRFVHLHRILAYYENMQKKKTGRDYELEKKIYSLRDVVNIVNHLQLRVDKPISFLD